MINRNPERRNCKMWYKWHDFIITALDLCFRIKTAVFFNVFVALNAPIRQYEDETFLLIWIQRLLCFYRLLVQTEASLMALLFSLAPRCFPVCTEITLIICLFLQVTTVFATKLKSFTFVPLLKRLPVENRIWKKVLQAGRPNQVRNTLETAQYGFCM